MESQRDPELRDIHNRSGLTTPDGMPLVWTDASGLGTNPFTEDVTTLHVTSEDGGTLRLEVLLQSP